MIRRLTAVVFALALFAAACGDEPTELASGSNDGDGEVTNQLPPAAQPPATVPPATAPPATVPPTTEPVDDVPDALLGDNDPTENTDPDPADPADPADGLDEPVEVPPADIPDAATQDPDVPDEQRPAPGAPDAPDAPVVSGPIDPAGPFERVESRTELLDPRIAPIEAIEVGADGASLLVRYWNSAEPCSGARVTVTEGSDTVEVMLETGLDPNAAAMSCIAAVLMYEIAVPLAAPLGSRNIVDVKPALSVTPNEPTDPFADAEFAVDQYLGLTEAEAIELGEVEQRIVRIVRIDDEYFALTQDYSPTRVNIELEAGVVVAAYSG